MTRLVAIIAALSLLTLAAEAEQMLPRCTTALDGQVSAGGCECRHDAGGVLAGRTPGWRWHCDLLRGPGAVAPVQPAGLPPPALPPGFTFAPVPSARSGSGLAY